MNAHMKFLDKKLLKTTIIKNRIFSVWDFFETIGKYYGYSGL